MLKKFSSLICILFALLLSVSCSNNRPDSSLEAIPLTTDEIELIEAFGEDLHIITDETYPDSVTELQYHSENYAGQVYQLEGLLKTTDINGVEAPFIYRTLNNNGEKTECGLPLKYLEKEIPNGSWISVTAIISTEDYNGTAKTVLEVVAVEAKNELGNTELKWNGSQHNH